MSTPSNNLQSNLEETQELLKKDFVERSQWGELTFHKAKDKLNLAKELINYLTNLPLEYLPGATLQKISNDLNQLDSQLKEIDSFKITQGDPSAVRDKLVNSFNQTVDNFFTSTATWIPFLAYQKGDVSTNIKKLTQAIEDAKRIREDAEKEVEASKKQVEEIIQAAREASASAGAAVFTKDFQRESDINKGEAKSWLTAAIIFAALAATLALLSLFITYKNLLTPEGTYETIQLVTGKVIILSLIISAGLWCARNYRILRHLSKQNAHRSLSLKTLQAFIEAGSNEQTRDAVLREATRCIFTPDQTGYLGGKGDGDHSNLTILETIKKVNTVQGS